MHDLSHHLTDEQLSAWIDHQLDDAEQAVAAAHLDSCAHCSEELNGLTFTVRALQALPEPPLPSSFLIREAPRPSFWTRVLRWDGLLRGVAAAAAAMFLVLLAVDLTSVSSPAIVPLAAPLQSKAGDTMMSRSAPTAAGSAPASAGAPQMAAAPAPAAPVPAAARRADSQAETAIVAKDSAPVEAFSAREAAAGASSSIGTLSPLTLTAGVLSILMVIVAVVRTVRRA